MKRVNDIPLIAARRDEAHKGDFGKVCIVAGCVGMSGAAALAGKAALRTGSGLVRVATAASALPVVAAIEPCYTTIPLAEDADGRISAKAIDAILNAVEDNDAVAIGPGLGTSGDLRQVMETLVGVEGLELMVDGDGLNNLAGLGDWPAKGRANLVLTPHPGEMKRLWAGLMRGEMPEDRQECAGEFARRCGGVVVLKGAGTVVTDGERVYVNDTGNPGMATAGSGDVLTGIVVSLLGQGLDSMEAAVLGVYVHGLAGDIAAEKVGQVSLMATDIIDGLSRVFSRIS